MTHFSTFHKVILQLLPSNHMNFVIWTAHHVIRIRYCVVKACHFCSFLLSFSGCTASNQFPLSSGLKWKILVSALESPKTSKNSLWNWERQCFDPSNYWTLYLNLRLKVHGIYKAIKRSDWLKKSNRGYQNNISCLHNDMILHLQAVICQLC